MSNDDLPELPRIPSFEELGISPEELAELEKELDEAEASGEDDPSGPGDETKPAISGGGRISGSGAPAPGSEAAVAGSAAAEGAASGGEGAKKTRAERRGEAKERKAAAKKSEAAEKAAKKHQRQADLERADAEKARKKAERVSARNVGGPIAPAPLGGMRGPVTVLFVIVAAWFLSSFRTVPQPVPASAPADAFSSARAMTHLVQIARAAHPPGSPEHARVRGYLLDALTDVGLVPSVQTAAVVSGSGPHIRTATVRNIVARKPGTASTGAILLTAHYDGRELSRAAGDDGVGVVTILEALRALSAGPEVENDIIVLFTDAEELGLLGARAFVDEHPWLDDVALVLSFEMRGGGGPAVMFETGAENGWIIRALQAADPAPAANALTYEVYRRMPNDTDFTPFREAGKQGLNFAAIGRAPLYHQQFDSPENLSEGTLQHQGVHALAMIQHLGNAELTSVTDADVAYLSVPVVGLVTYRPLWAYVLSGLILLLFALAGWVARKTGATVGSMVAGFFGSLLVGGLAAGVGVGMLRWLPRFHPEAGQLHGSLFYSEGWYVLVLACATFAFALGVFGLLRARFGIPGLAVGAVVVPVLAAATAGFAFPLAAMNLQWPVLAAIAGLFAVAGTGRSSRLASWRWILVAALALPVLAVLIPLTEILWLAMSFSMAAAIGLLMTIAALLVLPLLEVAREPNGWWAPVTSVALGGAFLGLGILTAAPDSDRPAPSTLLYTYDREAGSAQWATDPDSLEGGSTAAREWVTAAIGPVGGPVPLGLFRWNGGGSGDGPLYATAAAPLSSAALPTATFARSVAASPPVSTFPLGSDSAGSIASVTSGQAAADSAALAAIDTATVPAPSAVGGGSAPVGTARVVLRSVIGAELVAIDLGQTGPRLMAINGTSLPSGPRPEFVEHWGAPEDGIVLDFDASGTPDPFGFAVIETHFRPNELVEGDPFDRPPELAPNIRRLSDRAMIRTPVMVDVGAGTATVGAPRSGSPATSG